jgi:hypothetical protein
MRTSRGLVALFVLWGTLVLTPGARAEQPAAEHAQPAGEATAVLKRMAEFLAAAQRFSVTIRDGYDVVQNSGQKIEFGEVRKLTIRRPDRMRAEVEESDGEKRLALFDGKTITVYSGTDNAFATAEQPGSLDDAIRYVVRDLQVRLPLAMMLVSTFPQELASRVRSVEYVEETTILDVPCDHLAARTDDVDFQIWIARGAEPLPRRLVITYKSEPGQPQFWARFSDWNLSPDVAESLFAFTAPAGAERIPFLAQLHRAGGTPEKTGGEKAGGAK